MKSIFLLMFLLCSIVAFYGCSRESELNVNLEGSEADSDKVLSETKISAPKIQECFIKVDGNRPYGVAFDNKGVMYMVTAPSYGSGTLSKVSSDGTIDEIATLDGSFIGPGIDVDNDGNAYITVGDRLLKVTNSGEINVVSEGFSRCFDVALDTQGNVYVADDVLDTIYAIKPSGEKRVIYEGGKHGAFVLTGLVIDKDCKYLYARERDNIIKFDLSQNIEDMKPAVYYRETGMFNICIDNENNIYISISYSDAIKKLSPDGKCINISTSEVSTPCGVACGEKGFDQDCVYVAASNGIVRVPKK